MRAEVAAGQEFITITQQHYHLRFQLAKRGGKSFRPFDNDLMVAKFEPPISPEADFAVDRNAFSLNLTPSPADWDARCRCRRRRLATGGLNRCEWLSLAHARVRNPTCSLSLRRFGGASREMFPADKLVLGDGGAKGTPTR